MGPSATVVLFSSTTPSLRLQTHHLRFHLFVQAVLAVRAADAASAAAGAETLHRLEVLAIDAGLAEAQAVAGLHGGASFLPGLEHQRAAIQPPQFASKA